MNIKQIQLALTKVGFNPGPVDGLRGPKTTAAVKKFQRKFGLIADGIPGRNTQKALLNAISENKNPAVEPDKTSMSNTDVEPRDISQNSSPRAFKHQIDLEYTRRKINEIIVHCAATPEGRDFTVGDIEAWHKARGWNRGGYHYVVYRDGTIHELCPIGQKGIHCRGHNTNTIGISYIGGVTSNGRTPKDTRTDAQEDSLLWLTTELANMYNVGKITGHNQYAAKACPSFDVRKDELGNIPGFSKGIRK